MQFERLIDGPVAVIGDVHGQLDLLDSILDKLKTLDDYQDRWIVFIGDLVDRGIDSRGVIDRILELDAEHGKVTSVMGNHELAMGFALGIFEAPEYSDWDERWCEFYGADATFDSYCAEFPYCPSLREALPDSHVRFLEEMPWSVEHPEFFFVHAGLDPNQSFDMQRRVLADRDFSLSRPPWLCSKEFANELIPYDCEKAVVSGHVPFPEVRAWPQRILVDTTGGVEGELSCVLLPERILVTSALSFPEEPQEAPHGHQPRPQVQHAGSRPRWYEFWK